MSQPKKTKAQKPLTRRAKPAAPAAKAAPAARTSSVRAPRARMAAADPDEDAGKASVRPRRPRTAAGAKASAAPESVERKRTGRKAAAGGKAAAKGAAKPAPKKAAPPRKAKSAAVRTEAVPRRVEAAAKPRPRRAVRGRADDAPVAAPARPVKARRKAPVAPAATVSVPPAEAVKYGGGTAVPRHFEEERFLFPRNYEINRVRVVVRDPEWLFAYWDVNPRAFDAIRSEMGERVMALSRLTLKIVDPESSASEVILLPYGARSWYLRIDETRRGVVAELGITLPNGQFRTLARSNAARIPRVGPSSEAATESVRYDQAWAAPGLVGAPAEDGSVPGMAAGVGAAERREIRAGASELLVAELRQRLAAEGPGASDAFRR